LGSLEEGKRADFCLYDCADYREVSYFFGIEHAHAVYIDGRLAFSRTLAQTTTERAKRVLDAPAIVI
jgi:imidazolonepropionase-like amidohydrolase